MTWVWVAVAVAVVVGGLWFARGRGRNSGAARSRDVPPHNQANADVHGAATQHKGNIYGNGGGGMPF